VSVVHVSATELKRISVSIPSKDEQIRIVSVLDNYDNRILHSYEILKKMEAAKDGLLQQLFV
jgi:restriction endonuclease S subunit